MLSGSLTAAPRSDLARLLLARVEAAHKAAWDAAEARHLDPSPESKCDLVAARLALRSAEIAYQDAIRNDYAHA